MSTEDDKYETALDMIDEVVDEESLSAFAKVVAISAILNSLNPMTEEDMRRGMEVARRLDLP